MPLPLRLTAEVFGCIEDAVAWLLDNLPRETGCFSKAVLSSDLCSLVVRRTGPGCDTHQQLLAGFGRGPVRIRIIFDEDETHAKWRQFTEGWNKRDFEDACKGLHGWVRERRALYADMNNWLRSLNELDRLRLVDEVFRRHLQEAMQPCLRKTDETKMALKEAKRQGVALVFHERVALAMNRKKLTERRLALLRKLVSDWHDPAYRATVVLENS